MSSGKSAPITLSLSPSRTFLWGSTGCHLLACVSVAIVAVPIPVKVLLFMALGLSFVLIYRCYGSSQNAWFISKVDWSGDGQWVLYDAQGRSRRANLLASYVTPYLVILSFALGRMARRSVVILPDSAHPEQIRCLRVRLLANHQDV